MKKIISIFMISCILTITNAFALEVFRTENSSLHLLQCGSDIGLHNVWTRLYCSYKEEVERGSNYTRYQVHSTYAYVADWPGNKLGFNLQVNGAPSADYYDSYGNYIKSANMWNDTQDIWINPSHIPNWNATIGTDTATVNTRPASSTATATMYCADAIYGYGDVTCNLTIN